MRLPGSSAEAAILSTVIFPILVAAAGNIICNQVVVDHHNFNLEELGGARYVVHGIDEGPSYRNTTYAIDICKPLGKVKDVKSENQCPHGTRGKSSRTTAHTTWSRAC